MLNFNKCELAKRGRGVKDEFYFANLIGYQTSETGREVHYDKVTPDMTDDILAQIDELEDKHVILAMALDEYLKDKARKASNPVMAMAEIILKEKILTDDADKARIIAQNIVSMAKQAESSHSEVYEMMKNLKKK